MTNNDSLTELIDNLKSNDPRQGRKSAEELARIGAPAVAPLVRALLQGNDENMHRWGQHALIRIGGPAIEALLPLVPVRDGQFSRTVIRVLGATRDSRAVEPLLRVLNGVETAQRRRDAILALESIGDTRVAERLIICFDDPGDGGTSGYALREVVQDALLALGEKAVDPLLKALQDHSRSSDVRHGVAWVLSELRDERTRMLLENLLHDEKEPASIRTLAAQGLGKLHNKHSIPLLLNVLQRDEEDSAVRLAAAKALSRFGDDDSVFTALQDILQDATEDPSLRRAIAQDICRFGGEKAIPTLINTLHDPIEMVQRGAIDGLKRCGNEQALAELERVKLYGSVNIKGDARSAISAIKSRLGLPLAEDEDRAGHLAAQYGRVQVYKSKPPFPGAQDQPLYVLRVEDGESALLPSTPGYIEIGEVRLHDVSVASVVKSLHALLEHWNTQEQLLQKREQDVMKQTDTGAISRRKRRLEVLAQALHEIEAGQ